MTVLIYNNNTNRMETYYLSLNDIMPYANSTLRVREFRGASSSQVLWTDRRTMEAWVRFRAMWGSPIFVPYAFKRIGEGGHSDQSQHYAGTSFDVAQNLDNASRARMRSMAASSGLWTYVEPVAISPTWVHFDKRATPPACSAGYPMLRQGSISNYVAVLQDALETIGLVKIGIDGYFGPLTANTVRTFQQQQGLTVDGVVGCQTWARLTKLANGRWRRGQFTNSAALVETVALDRPHMQKTFCLCQ